jgi:hypothetical protein
VPTWRQIPEFPTYEASDEGLIRGAKPRHDGVPTVPHGICPTPGGRRKSNRLSVKIYDVEGRRRTRAVGRLVLRAFGFKPPNDRGYEAAYRDGDTRNNALANLFWVRSSKYPSRKTNKRAA